MLYTSDECTSIYAGFLHCATFIDCMEMWHTLSCELCGLPCDINIGVRATQLYRESYVVFSVVLL